ncbi:hypothetical protein CHS0354_019596 [Potamilus streckersoni]|uniref:TRPM SLOG domain-containing protein n=1 Tax=Potamilus streckersoni TaxID=2493646 RepID=A0AAE0T8V5_9BIVA|nr:hypothetical protein CHS0354_019596 [Potamilus streckersoni]
MAVNRVSPSQSDRNIGQDQESNKVNKEVPSVAKSRYKEGVGKRPGTKPIDKSDKTKWILKNIKLNTRLCNGESEENDICCCEKNQEKHACIDEQTNSNTEPVNAFGEITFDPGKHTAKYVLVDSNTKPSIILNRMKEKWKLEMPNLLISVASSTNCRKASLLPDKCRTNLVKAVQGTGAWIITDGKQDYVKECDGEAVMSDEEPIVIIGISKLETIHNKQPVNQQGPWPAEYPIEKISLDPHHSHFILVADGSEDSLSTRMMFREKLESEITNENRDTDLLFVLLVFEWDHDIMKTVQNALTRNIHVVIVKAYDKNVGGTEAASDITS